MNSQGQFNIQKSYSQSSGKSDLNYYPSSYKSFSPLYNNKNKVKNSSNISNDIKTTGENSYSFQHSNYEKSNNNSDNCIIIKKDNEYTNQLFKAFGDNNSLCNFSLFEKNVDINLYLEKDVIKKLSLQEYFECINEAGFLCLDIPFLDKKGNVGFNIFNPTLSSLKLILKNNKIREEDINKKYLKDNFLIQFLSEDLIQIEFDETNPPYNRDIIETKINTIHEILGEKRILLENIDKNKSYFSILWTPADTHKIKSSFLTFYTFDFKLIGTLVIKLDDFIWFTTFCIDVNNCKDFKKEYMNKISTIENFIKKCNNIEDEKNIDYKLFSHDYKRFLYNY